MFPTCTHILTVLLCFLPLYRLLQHLSSVAVQPSHLQCLHACPYARCQALHELLWVNDGHACQLLLATGCEKQQERKRTGEGDVPRGRRNTGKQVEGESGRGEAAAAAAVAAGKFEQQV